MVTDEHPGIGPGSLLAGYRLQEQVGLGGMAVVYRARDEQLRRAVALKVLAPALASDHAFRRRFIRESLASAAVEHPHIIPVYAAGEADGVLYIAMRFVSGGDLRLLLEREGALDPARTMAIISPVAAALDAAHGAGLVHRDVKPGNVLVDTGADRPDHVYLSDFGISKALFNTATMTGMGPAATTGFIGTVGYSAPEQLREDPAVDGRADQYSLACVAYELLTGGPPFLGSVMMAVVLAHVQEPPPPLSSRDPRLPAAADLAMTKALAKNARDRYESCADFADALREALGLPPYRAVGRLDPQRDHSRAGGPPSAPSADAMTPPPPRTPTIGVAAFTGQTVPAADSPAEPPSPAAPSLTGSATGPPSAPAGLPDITREESFSDTLAADVSGLRLPDVPAALTTEASGALVTDVPDAPAPDVADKSATDAPRGLPGFVDAPTIGAPRLVVPVRELPERPEPGIAPGTRPPSAPVKHWRRRLPVIAAVSAVAGAAAVVPFLMTSSSGAGNPGATGTRSGLPSAATSGSGSATTRPATTGAPAELALPATVAGDAGAISSLAFNPSGTALAVADTGKVCLWTFAAHGCSAEFNSALQVAFSPDGNILVTGNDTNPSGTPDGTLRRWDLKTQRLISPALADPDSMGALSISCSPDNRTLAAGDANGTTYLWDVTNGRSTGKFTDPVTNPAKRGVNAVAFGPGGTFLAVADQNGSVYLWNAATQTMSAALPGTGSSSMMTVTFSSDGTMIAAGAADGTSYLWRGSGAHWQLANRFAAPAASVMANRAVRAVAFSADGTLLAIGDSDGTTDLRGTASGTRAASLPDVNGGGVATAVFSPDGRTLATGDYRGDVYLWPIS